MKNFLLEILLVVSFFLQCTNTVRLNGTKKYYTKEWIENKGIAFVFYIWSNFMVPGAPILIHEKVKEMELFLVVGFIME